MSGAGVNISDLVVPDKNSAQQIQQQQQQMMFQQQQQQQQQQMLSPSQNAFLGDPQPTSTSARFGTKQEAEGSFWRRLFWAPNAEPGSVFMLGPVLRTFFIIFVMACFMATAVSRVVSTATAGSVALNGFVVGFVYAAFVVFSYSWRYAKGFPLHVHQAIIVGEMFHMHLGIVYGLGMIGMLYAGAALSGWFQSANLLNSAAVPGIAPNLPVNPTSYWGAMGIDGVLTILVVLSYMHNIGMKERVVTPGSIRAETYKASFGLTSTALLTGLAVFFSVVIGYPSGVFAIGNPVVYFGGAITIGYQAPFANAWTIPILWSIVWGIVGFVISLFTWNVNGLTHEDFAKIQAGEVYEALQEENAMITAFQQLTANVNKKFE